MTFCGLLFSMRNGIKSLNKFTNLLSVAMNGKIHFFEYHKNSVQFCKARRRIKVLLQDFQLPALVLLINNMDF